jgi:hypothetical protein
VTASGCVLGDLAKEQRERRVNAYNTNFTFRMEVWFVVAGYSFF